jgi:hypothetical protein
MNYQALDDVLNQGFLDIVSSNAGYPQEQLKAVNKQTNRSLNAACLLYWAEHRRRHPDLLVWWIPDVIVLLGPALPP